MRRSGDGTSSQPWKWALLTLAAAGLAVASGGSASGQGDDEASPLRSVGQGIIYEIIDTSARMLPGLRFDTDELVDPFEQGGFRRATVRNTLEVFQGVLGSERPDRARIVARANDKGIDSVMLGSGIVPMPRGLEATLAKNVRGKRVVGRKVRAVFRPKGGHYRVGTLVQVGTEVILGTPTAARPDLTSLLSLSSPGAGSPGATGQGASSTPTGAPRGTRQVGVVRNRADETVLQPRNGGFGTSLEISQELNGATPFIDPDSEGELTVIYRVEAREAEARDNSSSPGHLQSQDSTLDDVLQSLEATIGTSADGEFTPLEEKSTEFEDGVAKLRWQVRFRVLAEAVSAFLTRADATADSEGPKLELVHLLVILAEPLFDDSSAPATPK